MGWHMQFWLTEDEVFSLTRRTQPAAQLRQLKSLGYRARFRTDGTLVVPTDQFHAQSSVPPEKEYKMDFSHLGKGE